MRHHVEVQKVFYITYLIEAEDADAARALAGEKRPGEVVGTKLIARHVTNAHPIMDGCAARGCQKHEPKALDELAEGHI